MKKYFLALVAILICLCGCSNNSPTSSQNIDSNNSSVVETNKNKRYEFDLTMDNYWKFFLNTQEEYSANSYSPNSIIYENEGVLSYAYYEDVVFVLELSYSITYNGVTTTNKFDDVTLKMKANGYGKFTYSYEYSREINGKDSDSLYNYKRELKVKNVSGKVIFSV